MLVQQPAIVTPGQHAHRPEFKKVFECITLIIRQTFEATPDAEQALLTLL